VAFHPHSKHDNTLIILSSDSRLRVFELSLSPHVPEQDIPLFSSPRRGYTVDFDIPVPVSFTFGSGTEWLSWTIFILTGDGDVYLLSPILSTKCVLPRSEITRLKTLISYRSEIAKHDESCSVATRETCLNHTRWISDILGQITMGEFMGVTASPAFTGIETGDTVTFKRPNKVRPTPELQGPVLFQPAPVPMDDILPEANEIEFLDADGVGVFVITWAGGRVDVGVLMDEIEGVWAVKGVSREDLPPIRVSAYESIDLPISKNMWTAILVSHNDDEGVFIAADGGVWQLDFRSWLHELQQVTEGDEDTNETFENKKTTIKLIADERLIPNLTKLTLSQNQLLGYGLLFDPLLDYHLLTISSTFDTKFTELSLPNVLTPPVTRTTSPVQTRRNTKPATYLAYPFPDTAPLHSPSKFVLSGLRIPHAILREKDPLSTEAIKLLGEITVRIRNVVTAVLRVGEGLRRRIELQQKELTAHLSKLASITASVKQIKENNKTRETRLSEIQEMQHDLEGRANVLLRKLFTINQPQTSEAEDKWFKELGRVKTRIEGQRGLMTEVKTRIAEGKKYIELASRKNENSEEGGKKKLDGRVMDAIEEAYVFLIYWS